MKIQKIIIYVVVLSLLTACGSNRNEQKNHAKEVRRDSIDVSSQNAQHGTKHTSYDLEHIFEHSAVELFRARPMTATALGLEKKIAGGKYSHRLDDYSPQAEAKLRLAMRDWANTLNDLSSDESSLEENRIVMVDINNYFAGAEEFDVGYIDTWMGLSAFIVNQINGPMIDTPSVLTTNHKITTVKDAQDYLKRLSKFDTFVNNVLLKLEADTKKNWIAPKVIIQKTINNLNSFLAPEPKKHPLYVHFSESLKNVEDVSDLAKEKLLVEAEKMITDVVYPAYKKMLDKQNELLTQGRSESGIWAQPNGEAFYKNAVKSLGDTNLNPDQVHELGLSEVERILKEMDAIFRGEGITQGTVGERMTALNDDPQFLYEDSDAGRQELLDDLNGMIKEISKAMEPQFATAPPYEVEVRRIPVAIQDGAPGGQYSAPSVDGSQPGIYWINLRDMKANPKFDLKTLTYHEANPGHHWQVALNLAQDNFPMLRRIAPYNAFVEGWALYSEKVAHELGMYKDDPYGDLGRLKAELFRAVRLVVDTGLHHKKWTREQAIKYMAETTGTVESDVVAEIERYMVWPGQALGYKMGMINILQQRELARKELGDKFNIKEFHDLVLLGGAVPMSVLNVKIANWIESQR